MTDTAHFEYLEAVAQSLLMGKLLPPFPHYPSFNLELAGFVEPKERARTGRSGHHYTPKDTRRYEAYVKLAAHNRMRELKLVRFDRPVMIHLQVMDQILPEVENWARSIMEARLFFEHTGGDLDNKTKAVLDACNGVVYKDDRQIVQLFVTRAYDAGAGFKLNVSPSGLTKVDLTNINKILNAHRRGNG